MVSIAGMSDNIFHQGGQYCRNVTKKSFLRGWSTSPELVVSIIGMGGQDGSEYTPLPFRPGTLGYYAVPIFNCINNNCSQYQKKIRFTHCLNGKCESHFDSEPLDSRDCNSCKPGDPNHQGLECNFCGQPCPSCSGHKNRIVAQEVW